MQPNPAMMTANVGDKYFALIDILKGSQVDFAMSIISMLTSTILFVVGVMIMTDDNVERVFCIQPVVFLIAQSFTVTTVWRDRSMRQNYMVMIDKPTLFYTAQSVVFFVLALACTIFNFATIAEWKAFYITAAVWVGISTLSLSKVFRDWNYADIFVGLPAEDHAECFSKVSHLCKGSTEFRAFVWISALASCFLLCGIVWFWSDDSLPPQAKGFISVCSLWAEGSTFLFSKILREWRNVHARKDLSDNMPFQIMIVFSSLVSHVAIFLALATHRLQGWQRMHLIAAWGFALTTVFVVARHVKDRLDTIKLMESSEPQPGGHYANNMQMQQPMGSYQANPGNMQYAIGGQPQYLQQSPSPDGRMVQYGGPPQMQYNQYANQGPPHQYDGYHQAMGDRGQQLSARSTARNEPGAYM